MSSPLTAADVERIASLAHLALSEDEKSRFTKQLADILSYVAQIERVNIDGVPPTSHALLPHATLRDDVPAPSLPRDEVMAAAPGAAKSGGLVPRAAGDRRMIPTWTADEIRQHVMAGEVSARDVCEAVFGQIARLDPQVRAFLSLAPERALLQAARLDSHPDRRGLPARRASRSR